MPLRDDLADALKTEVRLLTFRQVAPDVARLGRLYLGLAILFAWIAGIGRYWDNPRAELWQSVGLGSIAYIFSLALVLWLITLPLGPKNWSYLGVLTFVGLTSPPGWLYAVPVERVFSLDTAETINVWFLAIVATWRVVLLFLYLKRAAGLSGFAAAVATFLPLVLIVNALTSLNLEHVVFQIMGGLSEQRSANDAAYAVLFVITMLSYVAAPVLLGAYIWLIRDRRRKKVTQ